MEGMVIVLTIISIGLMVAVKMLQDSIDNKIIDNNRDIKEIIAAGRKPYIDLLVEVNDEVEQLKRELQILEGIQSKMADELMKMNDLDKRIIELEVK